MKEIVPVLLGITENNHKVPVEKTDVPQSLWSEKTYSGL